MYAAIDRSRSVFCFVGRASCDFGGYSIPRHIEPSKQTKELDRSISCFGLFVFFRMSSWFHAAEGTFNHELTRSNTNKPRHEVGTIEFADYQCECFVVFENSGTTTHTALANSRRLSEYFEHKSHTKHTNKIPYRSLQSRFPTKLKRTKRICTNFDSLIFSDIRPRLLSLKKQCIHHNSSQIYS